MAGAAATEESSDRTVGSPYFLRTAVRTTNSEFTKSPFLSVED